MCSETSHCRFQENSAIKLPNEKNSVALWDEFTHQKAVSQKASFWFLSEDISFFTKGFNTLPNILLQIPWKQCYQTAQWKQQCNSVRWIHTSWSSFSEIFLLVFNWGYYLCHHSLQCDPKDPFSDFPKTVLLICYMKRMV